MTQAEWLEVGLTNGWCGPVVCVTHDGIPTSEQEDDLDFDDPCVPMLRVYHDEQERQAVEQNHSPSIWRKPQWARS